MLQERRQNLAKSTIQALIIFLRVQLKKKSEVFLLFNDHPSYMPKQHLTNLAKHLLIYKLTEKRKGEDAKIICIMVFYNVMVHVQLILRHL